MIFNTCKIKLLEEKYNLLIPNLPTDVTCNFLHITTAKLKTDSDRKKTTKEDQSYNMLNKVVFQCNTPTEFDAFLDFLCVQPLQARQKSSKLLANLHTLIWSNVDPTCCPWFFRMSFLALLPLQTRSQCWGRDFQSIEEIAAYADNVCSKMGVPLFPLSNLSAVQPPPVKRKSADPLLASCIKQALLLPLQMRWGCTELPQKRTQDFPCSHP